MDSLLAELKLNVKNFKIFDLGLSDFQKVYDFQKNIFKKVNEATLDSAFIICQHYPVITVGRSSRKDDLLVSESELKTRNIEIIYTERGGGLTYHGPGQLLIYPILNLNYLKRDINFFLRWLEELAIFILNSLLASGSVVKRLPLSESPLKDG
jgi:lipoate-protein ligase B